MIKLLFQLLSAILLLGRAASRDVVFDDLFADQTVHQAKIPKTAHFVFTKTRPLSWLEFAGIKSSIVTLGCTKVNIWVAPGALFEENIWKLVLAFPEVQVRETAMPTTIYGNPVSVPAHVSDIVRLEAVYNEGGKCYTIYTSAS